MELAAEQRAVAAALAIARGFGPAADDAIVLQSSNRLAVRLLPCDTLARVAPRSHHAASLEVDLALRLERAGAPVATVEPRVEPRVHRHGGYVITFWTYYASIAEPMSPGEYARALRKLHAGMRTVDLAVPHFTDRVAEARELVASRDRTPALGDDDRVLLETSLRDLTAAILGRGAAEQLLHGEPHPGNVLNTPIGPRFIDLETACRGPIEFDVAHAPEAVGDRYPGLDGDLLRDCRILVLAMVASWRWDRADQLPNGRELGIEWTGQLRAALQHPQGRTSSIAVDE